MSSYTGSAVCNVGGSTLHGALNLAPTRSGLIGGKNKADLKKIWRSVDYFLIDEVSMLSCRF